MWVQLKTAANIIRRGVMTHYQPGDWVEVGPHDAQMMLADGRAIIPKVVTLRRDFDALGCGIICPTGEALGTLPGVPVTNGERRLEYDYNLLLSDLFVIRHELIPVGFERLRHGWQIAAPFLDYKTLASDIGGDEERAATAAIIHDLRVPVYDTRAVFIARSDEGQAFMDAWAEEMQRWNDERLAFLRALYRCTLTMCALPTSWKAIK